MVPPDDTKSTPRKRSSPKLPALTPFEPCKQAAPRVARGAMAVLVVRLSVNRGRPVSMVRSDLPISSFHLRGVGGVLWSAHDDFRTDWLAILRRFRARF